MQRAIFLDRDNTLMTVGNGEADDADITLKSGVPDGLRRLRDAGFILVVTTNEPEVAAGTRSESNVDEIHQQIIHRIESAIGQPAGESGIIERFYYCPYHPDAEVTDYRHEHPWRKPQPGMIFAAARDLNIDLKSSWVIGDDECDVRQGQSAGCRTIQIVDGSGPIESKGSTSCVSSFAKAVEVILASDAPKKTGPAPPPTSRGDGNPKPPQQQRVASLGPPAVTANDDLQHSIHDLLDEWRTERMRRRDFTVAKMLAGLMQLIVVLLVLLAFLNLDMTWTFVKWISVAVLGQLVVITLLLYDAHS